MRGCPPWQRAAPRALQSGAKTTGVLRREAVCLNPGRGLKESASLGSDKVGNCATVCQRDWVAALPIALTTLAARCSPVFLFSTVTGGRVSRALVRAAAIELSRLALIDVVAQFEIGDQLRAWKSRERLTLVDLAESATAELLDDAVAFVQNFLTLLKHNFIYYIVRDRYSTNNSRGEPMRGQGHRLRANTALLACVSPACLQRALQATTARRGSFAREGRRC